MRSLYNRLDQSPGLAAFIKSLSAGLARRRGLPILTAIGLTVLSLVVHILLALIPSSVLLSVFAFGLLHVAIIAGFVGVLLAEPIGRG